jgi:hypothetical protein
MSEADKEPTECGEAEARGGSWLTTISPFSESKNLRESGGTRDKENPVCLVTRYEVYLRVPSPLPSASLSFN